MTEPAYIGQIRDRLGPDTEVGFAQVGLMNRAFVVSSRFEGLERLARRELAFGGQIPDQLHWFELLTPEEAEEESDLRAQMLAPETGLPTWPDALANGAFGEVHPKFRTESSIEGPLIATFFSLRGGVGRSTALAAAGHLLSDPEGPYRKRVIAVDLDLEAPGLAPLLGVEDQVLPGTGVVPLLNQLDVADPVLAEEDLDQHLVGVSPTFLVLPAGLPDADYAVGLGRIQPELWYEENPSDTPFHRLLQAVSENAWLPDVLLLDARTGLSAVSAPLIFDLSHVVAICMYPHPQARLGTEAIVGSLIRSGLDSSPRPYFVISPLAAGEAGEAHEARAAEWVTDWIEPLNGARDSAGLDQVLPEDQLTSIPYSEAVAVSDQVDSHRVSLLPYARIADWLAGSSESVAPEGLAASAPVDKPSVLASLQFGNVAGEELSREELESIFLTTDDVRRALSPSTTLITGRKGTGKSTVFNKAAQEENTKIGLSPPRFEGGGPARQWLSPHQFLLIERHLEAQRLSWGAFWNWHIAMIVVAGSDATDALNEEATAEDYFAALTSAGDDLGGKGNRLVRDLDGSGPVTVLFDGLDSQFGSDGEGRRRRMNAVSGLLDVAVNWAVKRVRLKVLLRHDLYRSAKTTNKSHLRSRQVDLRWSSQYDFLSVGLKQLLGSEPMRRHLQGAGSVLEALVGNRTPLEEWPDSAVVAAWHRFTSERMAGGDTAFTRNWVYTRLADANGDRTPRNLHLLLKNAVQLELDFTSRGQLYGTSLVRPRALSDALANTVSYEAVDALESDEFPELSPLLELLRSIPKTPFPPEALEGTPTELVELGQEVGLLRVDTKKEPNLVRVPELYRWGLAIGRRGQV
ncbi:MAG: KGGVGR-motif variant AAA ATPase [Solirubrobacterales bacterium]